MRARTAPKTGITINRKDADVSTTVDVSATLNVDENGSSKESAVAALSNSAPAGVTLTLYGGKSNIAVARNNSCNEASMTGASVNAPGGAVTVASNASSIAKPYVKMDDLRLGYVAVGLTVLKAEANGSFKAFIASSSVSCSLNSKFSFSVQT